MGVSTSPFGSDAGSEDGREQSAPTGLLGRLRHHFRTWPRRYVEMRVETREK